MDKQIAPNLKNFASHAFYGRSGGVSKKPFDSLNTCYLRGDDKSDVDENRARICQELQINAIYTLKQVHSATAIRVFKKDLEKVGLLEGDAIWTTDNIAIGVQTADCAPILVASDDGVAIAAIHAGWRGAVANIALKTIETMSKDLSSPKNRFVAAIGPCIGFDAFEVGPEVVEEAKKSCDLKGIVKKGQGDRFFLDLAGLIEKQLRRGGVERVEIIRECTASNIDKYFSYRGNRGLRGDQLSVIFKG